MVGAWPGQGGHQFSALNAAEEGPDPRVQSASVTTLCLPVTADYRSLGIVFLTLQGRYGHWLPVGSRWRAMEIVCTKQVREGRGKVRQYKTHAHRFTSHDY